jgi:hypothetical protein
VITGTLIAESLDVDASIRGLPLVIREIRRARAELSPEQIEAGLPAVWTLIDFEIADDRADALSESLSRNLGSRGWFASFQSDTESFVIFSGRVLRYPRGDTTGRSEAAAHARERGIPDPQLDWPV